MPIPITDGFQGPVIGHFEQIFLRDGKLHMCVDIDEVFRVREHNQKLLGYSVLQSAAIHNYPCVMGKPFSFEGDQ